MNSALFLPSVFIRSQNLTRPKKKKNTHWKDRKINISEKAYAFKQD